MEIDIIDEVYMKSGQEEKKYVFVCTHDSHPLISQVYNDLDNVIKDIKSNADKFGLLLGEFYVTQLFISEEEFNSKFKKDSPHTLNVVQEFLQENERIKPKPHLSTGIIKKRTNDYLRSRAEKQLTKEKSRFVPDKKIQQIGGASSLGSHIKQGKNDKTKTYFLAPHPSSAYFAYEILNKIGFNTPKARPINHTDDLLATKSIEGYIPIFVYIHDRSPENTTSIRPLEETIYFNPTLRDLHENYNLDMNNQVIVDLKTGEKYKISGNLFTADIGAKLLADKDFQPEECNVGLVKHGNRFYAYFIDKELTSFKGNKYEDNLKLVDERVDQSLIYKAATNDQKLFILNEIDEALSNNDFKKIFINSRTISTDNMFAKHLGTGLDKTADAFEFTAQSALTYYETKTEFKNKDRFQQREKIRNAIADDVIKDLSLNISSEDKIALKQIIAEDLRAPYYQELFLDKKLITEADLKNEPLKKAIIEDQLAELKALGIESVSHTPKM